jgi:hypothetical protein
LLSSASEKAEQATEQSAHVLAAAQAARASAAQAAADGKSANEKTDRMFQRSLRNGLSAGWKRLVRMEKAGSRSGCSQHAEGID